MKKKEKESGNEKKGGRDSVRYWRRSKSFYHKFLQNFLLLLLVPVVTILILCVRTDGIIRDQILTSSQDILNQFFKRVDTLLVDMKELNLSVTDNPECQIYARYSASGKRAEYQRYEVKQSLANLCRSSYYDCFVYFPNEDRIISGKYASSTTQYYFETYYERGNGALKEQFDAILNCQEKYPTLFSMNDSAGKTYLCLAMRQYSYRSDALDFVSAVVLKPEFLTDLMMYQSDGRASILMYNQNGKLLFNSGTLEFELPEDCSGGEPREISREGSRYTVQVMESEIVKGRYALVIPRNYFWERLSYIRVVYTIGMLLFVAVSGIVSYRLSLRIYQPISSVIGALQRRSQITYDKLEKSEFEYIESLFEQENEKNNLLTNRIRKNEDLVWDRFLVSMLEGNVPEQSGDNIFAKHGMKLCSNRFYVGVLLIEEDGQHGDILLPFILKNVFCELCDQSHRGYVAMLSDSRFAVLVNLNSQAGEEEMETLLGEGKAFLKQYYSISISIGMGRIHEGMSGIHQAYDEALTALDYRYLAGKGSQIAWKDICGREFNYLVSSDSRLTRLVMEYIKRRDERPAEQFVADVMDLYGINENASMETMECFKFEITSVCNMAVISQSYPLTNRKETIRKLLVQPGLEEFQTQLGRLLETLRKREQEYEDKGDFCKQTYEYIKEKYADTDLSLSMLSARAGISAAYLSRIFRDAYGVSIPDFIARVRIENAKTMLGDSSKSIAQIAVENGFLSSNVFIKIFKKQEGITPGVYRKMEETKG